MPSAGRPHHVDRRDEVEAREDRREAEDEGPHRREHDRGPRRRRVGRVEGPARVEAAREERRHEEDGARDPEVEAHQVELREGHVLRAEHHRQHEVAERRRDARDQEQEHHHRSVEGEHLVVGVRVHDRVARGDQLRAHRQGEDPAQEEREADAGEVHDPDALVVERERPAPEAARAVQVVLLRLGRVHARRARGDELSFGHRRLPTGWVRSGT